MPGGPDPLYVRARTALLDALDALAPHRDAVVLVGAQALYLYTDDADFSVPAHTTDADHRRSAVFGWDEFVLRACVTVAAWGS